MDMSSKSPDPGQLQAWDKQHVWHAFTQMQEYVPLIVERASGCTLVDTEGRELLDGVSSLWCNIHGHRHPRLDDAVRRQLDRVAHITLLGMSSPPAIELARRLAELAPPGLTHVFFSSDGSSAIEAALKMAFQFWRQAASPQPDKKLFVCFDDAYHGDTLGSASVGGVARFHELFQPLLFETIRLPAPDTYRLPDGVSSEQAKDWYLQQLERTLAAKHQEIAAVIVEPLVQAAAGLLMHPAGFLRGVRELTHRYDVLLIADEVATGFGRTGQMFACEHERVTPDLLCLGKGLTAGYLPMSATLATDRVYDAFLGSVGESRHFYHGHTYAGNCLAAAVALASLDVFRDEQTLAQLPAKVDRLQQHLRRLAEMPHVGDVRSIGLIGAVELVRDKSTKTPFAWSERAGNRVCDEALRQGVWIRPLGNVIVIMPPLSITLPELDKLCRAVEAGLRVVRG
jgi:adenosylmethionine---8-amino-7-oxononanoate aminotransferase